MPLAAQWLPGFVSAGTPPRFTGLPLSAAQEQKYDFALSTLKQGKVYRGATNVSAAAPWLKGVVFYGPAQAQADLESLVPIIRQGFALRLSLLPADANFVADKYTHETLYYWDQFYGLNGNQVDEWGRKFAGAGMNLGEFALSVAAYVAPFVPGVGPELAVVIALAQGKEIKDAILAGIKAELPGGPVAGFAFDVGVGLANGQDVKQSVLEATANTSPEAAAAVLVGELAAGGDVDPYVIAKAKKDWPAFSPLIDKATEHGAEVKKSSKPSNAQFVAEVKAFPAGTFLKLATAGVQKPITLPGHRAYVAPRDQSWAKALVAPASVLAGFGLSFLIARWF